MQEVLLAAGLATILFGLVHAKLQRRGSAVHNAPRVPSRGSTKHVGSTKHRFAPVEVCEVAADHDASDDDDDGEPLAFEGPTAFSPFARKKDPPEEWSSPDSGEETDEGTDATSSVSALLSRADMVEALARGGAALMNDDGNSVVSLAPLSRGGRQGAVPAHLAAHLAAHEPGERQHEGEPRDGGHSSTVLSVRPHALLEHSADAKPPALVGSPVATPALVRDIQLLDTLVQVDEARDDASAAMERSLARGPSPPPPPSR